MTFQMSPHYRLYAGPPSGLTCASDYTFASQTSWYRWPGELQFHFSALQTTWTTLRTPSWRYPCRSHPDLRPFLHRGLLLYTTFKLRYRLSLNWPDGQEHHKRTCRRILCLKEYRNLRRSVSSSFVSFGSWGFQVRWGPLNEYLEASGCVFPRHTTFSVPCHRCTASSCRSSRLRWFPFLRQSNQLVGWFRVFVLWDDQHRGTVWWDTWWMHFERLWSPSLSTSGSGVDLLIHSFWRTDHVGDLQFHQGRIAWD